MNQSDRHKIQANYKNLIEVMYSSISPHLISTFVLDLEMHADIDACTTEKRKMEKLLQLLPSRYSIESIPIFLLSSYCNWLVHSRPFDSRGASALKEFINALRPGYAWLASHMEEDVGAPVNYDAIRNYCNNNLSGPGLTESSFDNFKDMPGKAKILSAFTRLIIWVKLRIKNGN